jgi:molybdopterin molybdotransferase
MLSFDEARAKVIETVLSRAMPLEAEPVDLAAGAARVLGRVLAEDILADRNYPPFDRSIRDGYAMRASDASSPGAKLHLIGESRAGVAFDGSVNSGECVRILTGAPVPKGANAVVMQEYTKTDGDNVVVEQAVRPGQYFVPAGAESRIGEVVIGRGARLSYAELGMAAEIGRVRMQVTRRPKVAILATGDELVELGDTPGRFQIRNSNSVSIAAQVTFAGGEAMPQGNSPDDPEQLRAHIETALEADVVVISGGVSVGKYDRVEGVLREMGAEIIFDGIAVRPGKPATFGWLRGKPVFGLPGNPVSTMVTFELLVAPAIRTMGGQKPGPIPFFKARLGHEVNEKGDVAHFLPARVTWQNSTPTVQVQLWEGSGDIGAVVQGNCFLVVHTAAPHLEAGEWVDVLPRWGAFF